MQFIDYLICKLGHLTYLKGGYYSSEQKSNKKTLSNQTKIDN